MAITSAFSNSYKLNALEGKIVALASGGSPMKLALYTAAATMDQATPAYTVTNESNGVGYTAGGSALVITGDPTVVTNAAGFTFNTLTFGPGATFNSQGCMIYAAISGNPAMGVFDFGAAKNPVNGTLTITFPNPTFRIA